MEEAIAADDESAVFEAIQPPEGDTKKKFHRDGEIITVYENGDYIFKDVGPLPPTMNSEPTTYIDSLFSSIQSEIEIKLESDMFNSKVSLETLEPEEGDSGLVAEGNTGEGINPMSPIIRGAMGTVLPCHGNRENDPNVTSGGAAAIDDNTDVGKLLTLAELNGNKIKKPKYKKRKKPPPFIGPQRPIQFEDLEDIMNGVYDLHFDVLGSDEEPCPLSSSNESCNSSDSEGWLVESDDGNGAAACGRSSPDIFNKNLELVKRNLYKARTAKERLNNSVIFINVEGNVAALDARVREMVSAVDPKLEEGLNALEALASAPMSSLSIVKHIHLLETAARLCKYTPPPEPGTDRPSRSRHTLMKRATKICEDAENILARIMELFDTQNDSDFWEEVRKKVEHFENATKGMSENEKCMVTDEIPELKTEPEEKRYPMMMIDDPWVDDQLADDESEPEQASSRRLSPRPSAGPQKTRKKVDPTEPRRVLKPIENSNKSTTRSSSSNEATSEKNSHKEGTKVKARRSSQKQTRPKKKTEPGRVLQPIENSNLSTTGSLSSNEAEGRSINVTSEENSHKEGTKVKARQSSQKETRSKKNTKSGRVLKPIENSNLSTTCSLSRNEAQGRSVNATSEEKSNKEGIKVTVLRSSQKEKRPKTNTGPAFVSPLLRRSM